MRTILIAAAIASAFVAGAAAAQNPSASATSGGMRVRAGFTPDPITVSIYSGGGIDANDALGGSCVGMIASAPDYEFTYTAGSFPLTFAVDSNEDTSLIINAPDGRWYCDDDSEGLNPILSWGRPQSGSYDIWVGAVGSPGSSTLYITENQ